MEELRMRKISQEREHLIILLQLIHLLKRLRLKKKMLNLFQLLRSNLKYQTSLNNRRHKVQLLLFRFNLPLNSNKLASWNQVMMTNLNIMMRMRKKRKKSSSSKWMTMMIKLWLKRLTSSKTMLETLFWICLQIKSSNSTQYWASM